MKKSVFGKVRGRRGKAPASQRIGILAVCFFIGLTVIALLYALAVNDHLENVWQEHLDWLHQQDGR